MLLKNAPIRQQLMTVNLLTSGAVLLLTCAAFVTYEFITLHAGMIQGYTTRAEIIAANSTAALAFQNQSDAASVLAALKTDPRMTAACLYDNQGEIFAKFPSNAPSGFFPTRLDESGYRNGHLDIFCPVIQGDRTLGTVYIQSDLSALTDRYKAYAWLAAAIVAVSILVAYLLSRALQKRISLPILALAEVANAVSRQRDYSVRAKKFGDDELGLLTDAFNQMLADIQQRGDALREENAERRRAEEQLRMSLKEVNDLKSALDEHAIVAITDPQGKITYVNDKFCAISKYSREELLGQDHRIINSGHHPKAFFHDFWTTIAQGRVWKGEIKNKAKDGSYFWENSTIVPFLNEQGKPRQYVAIRADITERKQAEEKIRQLNTDLERRVVQRTAQLEAANKELEAFSYSISHDLRAPLRAVNGFAGIVLEDFGPQLPEEGRRHLERIRTGGQRMGELIDDLLAFSRLSRQIVNRQPVDTVRLAQNVLDELRPEQDGRPVEIKMGELPACHGDPALLKQVWVNLISNAVKYTRGREPAVIEIGCTRDNGEIVFFVRDNGAGFDMQYANKLFGVFQRLHRADEFEGTGVGLAIVQRIVHRHGGRVWAQAELNRGATFYFTIGGEDGTLTHNPS